MHPVGFVTQMYRDARSTKHKKTETTLMRNFYCVPLYIFK